MCILKGTFFGKKKETSKTDKKGSYTIVNVIIISQILKDHPEKIRRDKFMDEYYRETLEDKPIENMIITFHYTECKMKD